ncbi:hypothetical protein CK203_000007 [Vitis vinifera]|uniref:Uncharacterized protein n=1 Tax=Vitis vinifera TaxID=29760 RepID=A0A438KQE1_VITVI|nr:hypothetical protein CK203_000007 [Vitis vinifera]
MATRSGRSFRKRLTNSQRDEILIQIVDQLDSLHISLIYDPADLDDKELDISLASIVRRILAAPKVKEEDWHQTYIFQMLVRCGNQAQKLIGDSGSYMNVVSASMVECLKLLVEPHPQPYKYFIWCDVILMKVAHIILGRHWLMIEIDLKSGYHPIRLRPRDE